MTVREMKHAALAEQWTANTNDDSLRKMLYLASQRIVKHWHARCQNWDMVLSQLEIMFADRAAG